MDNKRPSWSLPSRQSQDEVFLTQENYKKYSCRPSFVEYLEKHLKSEKDREKTVQNNHDDTKADVSIRTQDGSETTEKGARSKGAEKGRAKSAPTFLGPSLEFPVMSKVSIESQKMFVEMLEALRSGQLAKVDLQEIKAIQDIKNTVMLEQGDYQQFVRRHAKVNHHLYNFIHPDVWDDFKADIDGRVTERVNKYQRHYSLHGTIGLSVGAVFKSDAVLTFEQTLLQVGNIPKLSLPEDTDLTLLETGLTVPDAKSVQEKTKSSKVVSEDPIAVSLARKHKVDIVISSSGLNILLDNQPPDYGRQWQLPVTVQRVQDDHEKICAHRVVFVDKPFPPQKVTPRDVNVKFFKRALRRLVCHKSSKENKTADDGREKTISSNGSGTQIMEVEKTAADVCSEEFSSTAATNSERRKRRGTDEERQCSEVKKSKISDGALKPKVENLDENETCEEYDEKFFVYNLWRFGKFKVLIRCSVDAYAEQQNKQKCYTFFSVLPKLEYQPDFGHEKLSHDEAGRFWLNSFIRQNTRIVCGRINVYNSKLLRVDELSINDILQQGTGFNPAQGMKMVFQVFQALKRLPEASYILSHKAGEIHDCLYKSVHWQSGSVKSSYDLQKTRAPISVLHYTEGDIPSVAMDCNLFMPWQISQKRIPCTFPPVSERELAMMTNAEAQQIAAANTSKKNKKKSKKGKESKKGRNQGPATKKSNSGAAAEQSWNANKKRKPVAKGKGKIFASFDDTQPAEKESEIFAVSRRASGAILYDDLVL